MGIAVHFYAHLIPLQLQYFWKRTTGKDVNLFIIGVAVVIGILLIVLLLKNKLKVPALNGTPRPGAVPRRFSPLTLHRMADELGLDNNQTRMLEFVLKNDGVIDIEHALSSPVLLDRHFKRAYELINQKTESDEERQNRLVVLFTTRNIIESSFGREIAAASTRDIPENTAVGMTINQENYSMQVVSSTEDDLIVSSPVNDEGAPLHFPQGTPVTLTFFGKGFSVDTRILGSGQIADRPVLRLLHSDQIKRLPASARRFRRQQAAIAAVFYIVHIDAAAGHRKETKLAVDKHPLSGDIIDISLGGCSMKTGAAVSSGTHLKIEFTWKDGSVAAALGQVLRTNQTGDSTIIHVKFLKIPRRSMNVINAMVYEYA
jgi:c-di-GMP-binding flagellar brake protein YcgR